MQSVMLYGAPVWYKVMEIKKYGEMLRKDQRQMLLRVISAYRTVSQSAVNVISAVAPIDLMVTERTRTYDRREDRNRNKTRIRERSITIATWQRRWLNNQKDAQWTKRLIPDIATWVNCSFRRTDYFLTQFLSGHGCFRAYVFRIGKAENARCTYCEEVDTAEHTVLACARWNDARRGAALQVGEVLTVESIVGLMIASARNWKTISEMIGTILSRKEAEIREQQREAMVETVK